MFITIGLYYRTSRLSATTAEDTEQSLVLLGRAQFNDAVLEPYTAYGEKSFAAADHVSKGLKLAQEGDALPDTSRRFESLQRAAIEQYDSAIKSELYLGQRNTLIAKSHRRWARLKLHEPERRIAH